MKKLFGVDFGTGGCKATVIDLEGISWLQLFRNIHLNIKNQDGPSRTRAFGLRHLSIPLLPAGRR